MNYFLFKPFSYQNLMPMIMQIESFMGWFLHYFHFISFIVRDFRVILNELWVLEGAGWTVVYGTNQLFTEKNSG
jgi:hypothetical protein